MTREQSIEAAVDALSGILPGAACWTKDGREVVGFACRNSVIAVPIADLAERVVDALSMPVSQSEDQPR